MATRLFDRLDTPAVREKALTPPPPPAAVTAFLGRLTLLHGVPFPYLVPDERLLPAETLKIFLIDPGWLDALVGGALSVGRGGTSRLLLNKAQAGNFIAGILAAARAARPPDRGPEPPEGAAVATEPAASYGFSGFLLRSRVLEAWPGLEVRAYRSRGRDPSDALALLRFDRIAPDIILGVVDGQLADIEMAQPPEGLHFVADRAPTRGDAAERVIDVAGWAAGLDGSAALAKARMSHRLRFVFRIGG